jgi:hypothetical protein
MSLLMIFEWIQETSFSIAIRESLFWFPFLIAIHVMSTALGVGLILALDVRLLNLGMRKTPVSAIFESLRPWAIGGITFQLITGVILFWSEPVKCYETWWFWIKMVAMFLAFGNAFLFDKTVYPTSKSWDNGPGLPFRAKLAGGSSLALWGLVIWSGRWLAYG